MIFYTRQFVLIGLCDSRFRSLQQLNSIITRPLWLFLNCSCLYFNIDNLNNFTKTALINSSDNDYKLLKLNPPVSSVTWRHVYCTNPLSIQSTILNWSDTHSRELTCDNSDDAGDVDCWPTTSEVNPVVVRNYKGRNKKIRPLRSQPGARTNTRTWHVGRRL